MWSGDMTFSYIHTPYSRVMIKAGSAELCRGFPNKSAEKGTTSVLQLSCCKLQALDEIY